MTNACRAPGRVTGVAAALDDGLPPSLDCDFPSFSEIEQLMVNAPGRQSRAEWHVLLAWRASTPQQVQKVISSIDSILKDDHWHYWGPYERSQLSMAMAIVARSPHERQTARALAHEIVAGRHYFDVFKIRAAIALAIAAESQQDLALARQTARQTSRLRFHDNTDRSKRLKALVETLAAAPLGQRKIDPLHFRRLIEATRPGLNTWWRATYQS